MSRSAAAGSHAAGTPGHAPGGCAGRCVPGQSARQYEGLGPMDCAASPGPQEECPWRLSDVIPARMVTHTLRTWICSHLTWRGQSSRPPAVSPSRVRPTAVSALAQCAAPPIRHFPLRRTDGGRDRRWDHPAVRPWRRRPVRRPHGTRAYQPERRWGPPVRDRALSGLASFRRSSTRWRRIMTSSRKPGRSCSLQAIDRPRCVSHQHGAYSRESEG